MGLLHRKIIAAGLHNYVIRITDRLVLFQLPTRLFEKYVMLFESCWSSLDYLLATMGFTCNA